MSRKILVTSGKGGVGKTSFCISLAYHLSRLGKRVAMLDLDLGLNNLDILAGIENSVLYDIVDVCQNKCRLKQALIDWTTPSISILPSSQNYGRHLVTTEKLCEIVDSLAEDYDYVLLDSPAGVGEEFFKAAKVCTEAIVITTPHLSSLRDASKVITILKGLNISEINFVVNRARGDLSLNGDMLSVTSIKSFLKCNLIGVIPESDSLAISSNIGQVPKEGDVFLAFKMLADNVDSGKKKIWDAEKKFKGPIGYFRRKKIG